VGREPDNTKTAKRELWRRRVRRESKNRKKMTAAL
jgi:hypothetical protein